MQIVELRVEVEKSQLTALEQQVAALNGKQINFKVGTGGGSGGGSDPTAGVRKGLKQTQQEAEKTGQSMLSVVGKVAKWTAVTSAVYMPIKAFKEAVSTIKDLDTEMVNVQKVTGASAAQMKQFQEQAYQLSTQYGRSVTDVAAAMTSFARAGYGDKLGDMAELSTLIQNVGYVSEDTADSMLLAVDAAWKLGGSHEELMKVIDGVDKITNQNATDFQKMAEGMTVAASVFAESGESIQSFAAMVGTGTAATQRGGSEIARGLRTIMMNIRQIKGETEDGELIDGESIAKASAALKEFAGISTMENGELRKASDVLSDLAHKWKDLDTVQQSAIAEALAGKRQANILTALMGSWEMYEKQIEEYANSAGTAFKENEIYMDSWAAKTEQLKSKWTDFVANFVTSDLATGFLDGAIKGVEFLDSGLGQATIKAAAFAVAMNGITKGLTALAGTAVIRDLGAFISLLSTEGIAAFGALSATLTPLMAIAALSADFMFMKKAIDDAYTSLDEQEAIVADLKTQYEQLTGAGSEYAQLMDKVGTGELTERERARLTVLNAQSDALERQIKLEEERQFQMFQQQESGRFQMERGQMVDTGVGKTGDVKRLQEMNKLYDEGYEKVKKGESSLEDYRATLQDIIADNSDWYEQMKQWEDLGFGDSFTEAQKEAMALYETIANLLNLGDEDLPIVKTLDEFGNAGKGITDFANQTVVDAGKIRQAFADAGLGIEEANAAIQSLRDDGVVVIDVESDGAEETLSTLEELGIATQEADGWHIDINGLEDLAGKLGLSKTEADKLVSSLEGIDGVSFDGAKDSLGIIYDSVQSLIGSNPNIDITATDNASGMIQTVEGEKESVSQPTNTELNATDNASGTIMTAEAEARRFGDMRPRPTISVNDQASGVLSGIVGLISSIRDKSVTIMTKFVQQGSPNGYAPTAILRSATGSLNFRGGPTLLGDELSSDGSPRPELVITKSGAFIAGMNGPVMTNLPAGARIYKYSDTLDILSGEDMSQLQAFAGGGGIGGLSLGTRYLRGKNNPTSSGSSSASGSSSSSSSPRSSTSSSSGSRSSSGGSSSSRSSGSRSGGSSSGGSTSGGGSNVDTLKEELELLEAQYSFLEASNASTEELWGKSEEIKAKLHQINDTLRSTGGKEKDIVENSTKWWQETEKQRGLLEGELSLLEAQYSFMEASGYSAEELNAKSAEIQDKLHEINELARATGASQEDILQTSTKWWQELKKIQEVQRGVYQNERSLLQSEADLMEHQNKSAGERIGKLREIQNSLQRETEYMQSIKASQAEINQLSIQWWEIEQSILAIQQDLVDQLNAAMTAAIDSAEDRVEDSTKTHQENIKRFEKEREDALESLKTKYKDLAEAQEIQLDIDRDDLEVERAKAEVKQKQLDIDKARIALENAQRDRSVRYYNASTGQWEWGADAQKVKQAQEAYDKAQQDRDEAEANLKKEELNLAYEREVKATEDYYDGLIQAEEDAISDMSDTLSSLKDRWDEMYQRMFGSSTENIEKILQQMLEQGLITEEQANEIRAFWKEINGFAASIDDTTKKILKTVTSFADALKENPNLSFAEFIEGLEEDGVVIDTSKFSQSLVDFIQNNPNSGWQAIGENGIGIDSEGKIFVASSDVHDRRAGTYYSEDENGNGVYVSTGDMARSHFYTDDNTNEQRQERATQQSQSHIGGSKTESSHSTSSSTSASSSSKSDVVSQMQSNSAAWHNASDSEKQRLADENKRLGESQGWTRGSDGVWRDSSGNRVYDSGGILSGLGGIKATSRDEIVIPPDLAEFMLRPSANRTFQSRVSELSYLYGAEPIPGTLSNNRSSNDHYGDTYTFGNVTLTEEKARNTTVYELARMSRSLGIYRNG